MGRRSSVTEAPEPSALTILSSLSSWIWIPSCKMFWIPCTSTPLALGTFSTVIIIFSLEILTDADPCNHEENGFLSYTVVSIPSGLPGSLWDIRALLL